MDLLETISETITQGSMCFNSLISAHPNLMPDEAKGVTVKFKQHGEDNLRKLASRFAPRIRNSIMTKGNAVYRDFAAMAMIMAKTCYADHAADTSANVLEFLCHDTGLQLPGDSEHFLKTVVGFVQWFLDENDPPKRIVCVQELAIYLQKNCPYTT